MKLDQVIQYENIDEKRPKGKKRAKKGFRALSDDNEEVKGNGLEQQKMVFGDGLGNDKRIYRHEVTSLGDMVNRSTLDRPRGSAFELDTGL